MRVLIINILHLTLKKQWFDMIASGEKREEYREIKKYWNTRLNGKVYDAVNFRNGYSKDAPAITLRIDGEILCRKGKSEWGAPENAVWVIPLGEVIKRINIK